MPSNDQTYEKRKKQVQKIAKHFSDREGKKVSLNTALNILVEETAKNLKT